MHLDFSGPRHGAKLYEEPLADADTTLPTAIARLRIVQLGSRVDGTDGLLARMRHTSDAEVRARLMALENGCRNLRSLASDCGISQPTARQGLTVLQASHLVTLLAPHHRNFGKRLVQTPKLYFLKSGLLCYLLRIGTHDDLQAHALRGAVFETWVVGEALKHCHNLGLPPDLTF